MYMFLHLMFKRYCKATLNVLLINKNFDFNKKRFIYKIEFLFQIKNLLQSY